MPTESASGPGVAGPSPDVAVPGPTGVTVADQGEVAPRIARAGAELTALKRRLLAATRRAEAAEALAGDPEQSLEDEVAALDHRLEREHVEHRRRLDAELVEARAEAVEVVARARAEALETVRRAGAELEMALAARGGAPADLPLGATGQDHADHSALDPVIEVPTAVPPALDATAPADPEPWSSDPSPARRLALAGPVVPLTVIAVLLLLILIRVW